MVLAGDLMVQCESLLTSDPDPPTRKSISAPLSA